MPETYPGNVRVIEKKLTDSSLFFSNLYPRHGDLMLFGFGITSKWAVLIKRQFDGFEDEEVEIATPVTIQMDSGVFVPGFEIARGARRTGEPGDYIEEQPAMRSNFEIRWSSGDWNAIDLAILEVTTEESTEGWVGPAAGTIRLAQRITEQGPPLVSTGQSTDAMEWTRLPGYDQGSTAFPAPNYTGEPNNGRFLVIIPVYESGYDTAQAEQEEYAYPGPRNPALGWQLPLI
jgi:hypothetical protein